MFNSFNLSLLGCLDWLSKVSSLRRTTSLEKASSPSCLLHIYDISHQPVFFSTGPDRVELWLRSYSDGRLVHNIHFINTNVFNPAWYKWAKSSNICRICTTYSNIRGLFEFQEGNIFKCIKIYWKCAQYLIIMYWINTPCWLIQKVLNKLWKFYVLHAKSRELWW